MAESLNETFVIPFSKENKQIFSDDSLVAGDSTRSLLTPLYASDYESISKRSISSASSSSSSSSSSLTSCSSSEDESSGKSSSTTYTSIKQPKRYTALAKPYKNEHWPQRIGNKSKDPANQRIVNVDQNMRVLTKSWEEWIIEKAIDDLKKVQLKRELKQKRKIERNFKKEQKQKRKEQEEDNRKKWIAEKNYEYEKKRKELEAQKEFDKLKEEQKREIIKSKSKIAYERWLKEKEEEMKEQASKMKQGSRELKQKGIERREASQLAYKKWLKSLKTEKKRGKNVKTETEESDEYFRKLSGPMPSYVNPVPWSGAAEKQKSETFASRKEKRPYESPPLLWRDYYERLGSRRQKRS